MITLAIPLRICSIGGKKLGYMGFYPSGDYIFFVELLYMEEEMGRYSYVVHTDRETDGFREKRYLYQDLMKMTTYQLRDICHKERLIKNTLMPLDKGELIRLIMRYRGKRSAALIKDYQEGGLERIEGFLKTPNFSASSELSIQIPSKLVIYEGVDVDYFDRCLVRTDMLLSEGNLILIDDEYNVYSVFNLEKTPDGVYFITKSREIPVKEMARRQYSILYLEERESEFIYELYNDKIGIYPAASCAYKIPIIEFRIEKLPVSDLPLVIDFGTANTTAGIFSEKQDYKLVKVLNKSGVKWDETVLIPSILGIKNIYGDKASYEFGYEAQEIVKNNYLDEELPVFYDIKRWINDVDRQEKVIGMDGGYLWIARKELLKSYLEYIIMLAGQRFKCRFQNIQILTPVRQKEKFRRVFESLLKEYKIECGLDEGTAVLFHSISNLVKNRNYQMNCWYKALIIDCGGGTTDLTSCDFKIDNNRVSYQIEMACSYENGDTNFGGNNLTYRIMQLVKIRLAEAAVKAGEDKNYQCLKANNFRLIDESGHKKIYEELESDYKKAEEILPTKFSEYEQAGANEYFKVKNNYYYLFGLCERIKKKFFTNEDLHELILEFGNESARYDEGETTKGIKKEFIQLDKWKLSIRNKGMFVPYIPKGRVMLYLYEISALLMPDVYSLVKKFFEQDFIDDRLSQYNLIKLTGQSCRSDLFLEALKEFIPGRVIQDDRKKKDSEELKVCCIDGALFYFRNKKMGYMEINHTYETGALPYELIAYTHEDKEAVLIKSLIKQEYTGHISRFMEGDQVRFYLRDTEKTDLRSYSYHYESAGIKPSNFEEIEKRYPGIINQDEIDNIVNGESKFFVWPDKVEWGFYVLPVLRKQDLLYIGESVFYDFEDDTWEENFFNGTK